MVDWRASGKFWRGPGPAVVILELGANDGLRGLPVAEMKNNLAAMIARAKRAGARVLLVGMRMPPNYGPDYTEAFAAAYAELARRERVALVPFLFEGIAAQPGLFQADGMHPTEAGQPVLLDNVWPRPSTSSAKMKRKRSAKKSCRRCTKSKWCRSSGA